MKKIIAILTTAVLLLGVLVLSATADATQWSDKIEAELLEKMESMTEDELVSIYIWRNGGELESMTRILCDEYNMNPAVYEDDIAFEAYVVPAIEEAVRAELAGDGSVSEEEINAKINEEILKEMEKYRTTKLLVMKEVYKESNDKFLATYVDTENRKVEYVGGVTGTIILDATKEEIIKYANAETVQEISLNSDSGFEGNLDITGDVEVLVGDVNGDLIVDNLDAAAILKYDAGIKDIIDEDTADYNGDGIIDNLDAALILKYDAGL